MMRRIGLLRWVLLAAFTVVLSGCSSSNTSTTPSADDSGITTLQITDVRLGTGADAVTGRTVVVNYTGWIWSNSAANHRGTQFDTSIGKQPFTFVLGAGQVIRGWDQGVVGMKVGGLRTLTIPPSLAYGASGNQSIPPNATLIFDIDLLDVR